MKIPSFFRKKVRGAFHMKSGAVLPFVCDEITVKRDGNYDITAYKIVNGKGAPLYVRLDDISAI